MQYGTPMYQQYPQTVGGNGGYYQVADMTHYSQMYPSMQTQDYYGSYSDVYHGAPTDQQLKVHC